MTELPRRYVPPLLVNQRLYLIHGRAMALVGQFEQAVERMAVSNRAQTLEQVDREKVFSDFIEYVKFVELVRDDRLSSQIHKDVAPKEDFSFLNHLLVEAKNQRIWLAHDVPRLIAGTTSSETGMDFLIPLISQASKSIATGLGLCQSIYLEFDELENFATAAVSWVIEGDSPSVESTS